MATTSSQTRASERIGTGTAVQRGATIVGATFLLIGILGFVPGVTSNYSEMEFAGHESRAELLGIFQVSVLHNLVHGLFGLAGLLLARTWNGARTFLIGGGVIYLLLWVYGMVIDHDSEANFVPVNAADDMLHLALGVGMIGLGLLLTRADTEPARRI